VEGEDVEAILSRTQALQAASSALAQSSAGPSGGASQGDDIVDAEFEEADGSRP